MASMISNAAMATASAASQATMVAPFTGLRSSSSFAVPRKTNDNMTKLTRRDTKVNCMQVWPPRNLKKFETLSYLPPLTEEQLLKEINYLLVKGWVPCIEFEVGTAFVYRENNKSPGYYDGRYWTMWKLPMFGCTDAAQVAAEVVECKNAYPDAHIRIIGFDNKRQVQCISFIAYKPE